MTAKDTLIAENDDFTLREMWAMRIDCIAILTRLLDVVLPHLRDDASPTGKAVREAWRYKPPRRRNGDRSRKARPANQNQPPASYE
jgi:hypothetical protein